MVPVFALRDESPYAAAGSQCSPSRCAAIACATAMVTIVAASLWANRPRRGHGGHAPTGGGERSGDDPLAISVIAYEISTRRGAAHRRQQGRADRGGRRAARVRGDQCRRRRNGARPWASATATRPPASPLATTTTSSLSTLRAWPARATDVVVPVPLGPEAPPGGSAIDKLAREHLGRLDRPCANASKGQTG